MLKAEGLAAFRGERLVFAGLSFAVPVGGALVLAGPNGSGKSTLLRVLAGLCRAEAGELLWDGRAAMADPYEHARRVAYIGHQDAVKPGLTVAENLAFYQCFRTGAATSPHTALAHLGLAELADLPARMLSAGQKRRLALSRLAIGDAPLWLLDEPTLGLDSVALTRFGTMLQAHRDRGGIVVAATHVPLPMDAVGELRLS